MMALTEAGGKGVTSSCALLSNNHSLRDTFAKEVGGKGLAGSAKNRHPPRKRGSSPPRLLDSTADVSEYWITRFRG